MSIAATIENETKTPSLSVETKEEIAILATSILTSDVKMPVSADELNLRVRRIAEHAGVLAGVILGQLNSEIDDRANTFMTNLAEYRRIKLTREEQQKRHGQQMAGKK